MLVCQDSDELATQCTLLLQDANAYQAMSTSARQVAEANRGALDRLLKVIGWVI